MSHKGLAAPYYVTSPFSGRIMSYLKPGRRPELRLARNRKIDRPRTAESPVLQADISRFLARFEPPPPVNTGPNFVGRLRGPLSRLCRIGGIGSDYVTLPSEGERYYVTSCQGRKIMSHRMCNAVLCHITAVLKDHILLPFRRRYNIHTIQVGLSQCPLPDDQPGNTKLDTCQLSGRFSLANPVFQFAIHFFSHRTKGFQFLRAEIAQ